MSDTRSSGCGVIGFLVIVALLIAGAVAGGWIYLVQTETQTQIIIDKEKVKSDTHRAVEKSKEVVDQATKNVKESVNETAEEVEQATDETEP